MNSIHSLKLLNFHQLPFLFMVIGTPNVSLNPSIIPFHWILRTRGLFKEIGVIHTSLHGYQSQPSSYIVYHTKKFKMHLIASLVHIPAPMKPIVVFEMSKYSLHDSSDSTLLVTLLLTIQQASVAIGLVSPERDGLCHKHNRFISTKQFVKFLRFMNTGGGKTSLAYDTRTLIYS